MAVAIPRAETSCPTVSCRSSTSQVPRANTLTKVSIAEAVRAACWRPDIAPTRWAQRINSRLRRLNSERVGLRSPKRSTSSLLRRRSLA